MTKARRLRALQNQVRRLQHRLEQLEQLSNRYSWIRLAIFALGAIASLFFFLLDARALLLSTVALTVLSFVVVVNFHQRLERGIDRHRIWAELKAVQIARMKLDWDGIPAPETRPAQALEFDLDLVGPYSLHRLLDTTVSRRGSRRLRSWLAEPVPDPEQTTKRQQLVRELAPRPLFRHKLILGARLSAESDSKWRGDTLLEWLDRSDVSLSSLRTWLSVLAPLAALNVLLFSLDLLDLLPPLWQATLVLYFGLTLVASRAVGEPFQEAARMRDALERLSAVFRQLETYSYRQTPHLRELCAPFREEAQCPSQHLASVNRIVAATGVRGNPLFWLLLNAVVPWDVWFAYRLGRHKEALSQRLPTWLDVWFELEALCALANLAYLNPHFSFPKFLNDEYDGETLFQALGLGHLLIPDAEKVCNDFAFRSLGEIQLFTGSNMSGKSTFLRTVGINLCLAQAGGPVDARHLQTAYFRLWSCMRISDSVTDGISYFYGEVKCLKALLAELEREHPLPLIYFIDEIFRGTNNRERLIGSRAYIRALAGKRGVGLISTHDLELVTLSEEIPDIQNHHFRDEVMDGRMVFDFKLHPGPSPTTNALKIMRMEGLPV